MWLMMTGRAWGKTLAAVWWVIEEIVKTYDPSEPVSAAQPQRIAASLLLRASRFLIRCATWGRLAYSSKHPKDAWQWEDRVKAYGSSFGCGCRRMLRLFRGSAGNRLRGPGLDKAYGPTRLAAWPNYRVQRRKRTLGRCSLPTLRESESPRIVGTTTPKPIKLLHRYNRAPDGTALAAGGHRGTTPHYPPKPLVKLIRDTYRGRIDEEQELEGKLLTESPFALWKQADIDLAERLGSVPRADLQRVVVSVDPSISQGGLAAECGIVIVGRVKDSERLVVVDDLSGRMDPEIWGQAVHNACRAYDCPALAEDNQGGAMVHQVINQDPAKRRVPVLTVHASESKRERAIPVAALYGRGQVGHARRFAQLNGELTAWDPSKESPNRLDALVHGLRELAGIRRPLGKVGKVEGY